MFLCPTGEHSNVGFACYSPAVNIAACYLLGEFAQPLQHTRHNLRTRLVLLVTSILLNLIHPHLLVPAMLHSLQGSTSLLTTSLQLWRLFSFVNLYSSWLFLKTSCASKHSIALPFRHPKWWRFLSPHNIAHCTDISDIHHVRVSSRCL